MTKVVDASGKFKDRSAKCPVCAAKTNALFGPFCSQRCRDVDLGKWVTGAYYISAMTPSPLAGAGRIVANDDSSFHV